GIDAAPDAIAAAAAHAAGQGLSLAYRVASPEMLADEGKRFQLVTALEVIEHVPDPDLFLRTLSRLLEPEGLLVLSTLNRTAQSFLAAKVAAEYILRWLPPGTHDWRRFLTPAELAAGLRQAGLRVTELCGLGFDPLSGRWRTGGSLAVNYLMAARK
ncbi:MAG TPA: bifunctional 2-polyprenyl-6-hydroxyphenol methylase/3-demethylubiquinol 3-O-methyltransferase UbiG, partial [Acetobacteraceae bacterium]|nr:bifunctional 2-polyprenyl-6-hydroxyphenol methylase/3-demethylubiquinol 3-O-methyltransferase UbiG [Acetobacteraceae bacterium]